MSQTYRRIMSRRRRAMAVILVLAMLAVTLAVAHVMLRSHSQTSLINRNFDRQATARDAAYTGLRIALREISAANSLCSGG